MSERHDVECNDWYKKDDYRTELSGRSERILTRKETGSTMTGGLSVLSSAVLKSSETSASCRGEEVFLTPDSLLPLHMRERLGVCEDKGEACASKLTLKPCKDELAMLPLPLARSIMDLDLLWVCFDWRIFGNLDVLGVEAEDE